MKYLFIGLFAWYNTILSHELPMLYNKNHQNPRSSNEIQLVNHAKASLEKALHFQSKLNEIDGTREGSIFILSFKNPSGHLLNNLCELPSAVHLQVGLYNGGSFVAALYGNQDLLLKSIGIDWFKKCSEKEFYANCSAYLDMNRCKIINSSCFNLDKSLVPSPIDIYYYNADHSMLGHQTAFTYYDDLFSETFIAVVDRWKYPWVRRPTFKAFEKLDYHVLYEGYLPPSQTYDHGLYIVVIKKSIFPK